MKMSRPFLAAAGLLVCGLSAAAPALACPGESAAEPKSATRASHHATAAAAPAADMHSECAYMNSRRAGAGCCGTSFGSKLFAASVPAGLIAFGLGWLSGGRRRRDQQA